MAKFKPRERKHKVLARQKIPSDPENDANTTQILPLHEYDRASKKAALKDELIRESQSKISGKKRKRLDKYIDTKLKKEENLALLKKLAAQKVDTSLFQSSRKLGSGGNTKREVLRRALAERKAGVDIERNDRLLLEERVMREYESGSEASEREDDDLAILAPNRQPIKPKAPPLSQSDSSSNSGDEPRRKSDVVAQSLTTVATTNPSPSFHGSGLKQPLEVDESGRPIIHVRKRRKMKQTAAVEEEIEWEGFSSEEEHSSHEHDPTGEVSEDSAESEHEAEGSLSDFDSDEMDSPGDDKSGESSGSGSETSPDEDHKAALAGKTSAFKAWATQQRNEAIGFVPSTNLNHAVPPKPINFKPRDPEQDPLPPELESTTASDATRKAFSVTVARSSDIQEARLQLPIVAEEQKIMEAIHNNDVVVVWGATGSGKTTQVPQFLFEAGYGAPNGPTPGMIGITQPRRVAAVSMANRVGVELGDHGAKVAYQIRFDTTTKPKTAIKFMTDGVLLREVTQDFILRKYSAIVVDEAHERSVNTDILIGMLSRIVDLRAEMSKEDPNMKPLKLVIMSATLRISDFTSNQRLFRGKPPPLVKAEGRQYTVVNHFARRTERDYVEEMYRKVCRGHRKLPKGGMLVFLTGQSEIIHLAKRLKQTFASTQGQSVKTGVVQISPTEVSLETEDIELESKNDDHLHDDGSDSEGSVITGLDDPDDKDFIIEDEKPEDTIMNVHVLPLYSQLPTNQQQRVFEPPPDGSRLIVLATNVAETSLTIPGIRYVFDCGRAKEKKYDSITGVQSFEIGWISKASANQRSGRAGRTGPGHCYRLYSSALLEREFEEYAIPEVLRTPLEGVVLQMMSMGAPVLNFPFPTPPDLFALQKAKKLLSHLGAISADEKLTKTGEELSLYPLNPRYARMLAMGLAQSVPAQTIALVAALSVPELLIPEHQLNLRDPLPKSNDAIRTEQDNIEAEARSHRRKAYNAALAKLSDTAKQSDCIRFFNALCAYAYESSPSTFCLDMFLNPKAMHEAAQLRAQLTAIVRTHRPTSLSTYQPKLPVPGEKQINFLKQICAAGFIDQIALRADFAPVPPNLPRKPKTAVDVPYVTLFPSFADQRSADAHEKYVFLHPSSILARTPPAKMPVYLVYSHLQRASPSSITDTKAPKTRMHALTPVTRPQIINIALNTPLLQVSKPKGRFVDLPGEGRRECEVEFSLLGEKGTQGWGLGVQRVVQKKSSNGGWIVEKILW